MDQANRKKRDFEQVLKLMNLQSVLTIHFDKSYDESSMLVKKAEIPKDREQRRELAGLVNKPVGITIFR